MSNDCTKILLVYIEPTPYIVALINAIIPLFVGQIDVVFLEENRSQNWNIRYDKNWILFPEKRMDQFRFIMQCFFKKKYHMIHVAGWGERRCLLFIMLAKLFRIPVIVESDTPMHHQVNGWKRLLKKLFYPLLFNYINLFLPGGTRQAKYIEHYGVNSNRIIPVQMTVDVEGIRKISKKLTSIDKQRIHKYLNISEENIIFLFVGRLVHEKGLADLVLAFRNITHKKITLLIVGSGEMQVQIQNISRQDDRISYAGRLEGNALIEAFFIAHVVVLPSHFEPWGLVVNEAMALGKAVIVSDRVGCIDDLVADGETGFVVKAGHPENLQAVMELIIKNPEAVAMMGKKAAQKISTWTLENEAKNICQAWAQIIKIKVFSHDLNS